MVPGKVNGTIVTGNIIGIVSSGSSQRILRCKDTSDVQVNQIISQLGSTFTLDIYKINEGYPVLSWENGKYNK